MFETLVVTKTQKRGARSLLSLPAALTFHAAVGLGFAFFSLYAPDTLPAPPYSAVLWEERFAIPVTTVDRKQLAGEPERRKEPTPAKDDELRAPAETPTTVQDAPPAGTATGATGPDVPYGLPSDLVGPGDVTTQPLTGAVPVLKQWEVLQPPRLVTQVRPEYPPALRMMGVSGKVVLEVMVDENGEVSQVTVVTSPHPLLSKAAEEAVRRWKYTRPVSPAGGSARVLQTVVVDFTLR